MTEGKRTPGLVEIERDTTSHNRWLTIGENCVATVWQEPGGSAEANARFIKKAWNSYDRLVEALNLFVNAFENDFVLHGELVDSPARMWCPIVVIYKEARKALAAVKEAPEPKKEKP